VFDIRQPSQLDALAFAGGRSFLRKALGFQVRHFPSLLVSHGGVAVALASFHAQRRARVEFVMMVEPGLAKRLMVGLVRLTHLTLARFAHDGILVFAHIRETDERAKRMAGLTGFRPGGFRDGSIWLFKGAAHDRHYRRADRGFRQEGREGPGAGAPAAKRGAGPAIERHGGGNGAHRLDPQEPARAQAAG
jgi:hypothetical protein